MHELNRAYLLVTTLLIIELGKLGSTERLAKWAEFSLAMVIKPRTYLYINKKRVGLIFVGGGKSSVDPFSLCKLRLVIVSLVYAGKYFRKS
jgi:hypothetical protein